MVNIFWDLDGTLTDPKEGITKCIQFALGSFGHAAPDSQQLTWCIGPPLADSFKSLVPDATEEHVKDLVEAYRRRYTLTGLFENKVYAGIGEPLSCFPPSHQFVVTSKPWVFAERILQKFDLANHFAKIYGSELSGERGHKGDLIDFTLEQQQINSSKALMIGDRHHDILGAKRAGVRAVGVLWGYGSIEEIEAAQPDDIVRTPAELAKFLKQLR